MISPWQIDENITMLLHLIYLLITANDLILVLKLVLCSSDSLRFFQVIRVKILIVVIFFNLMVDHILYLSWCTLRQIILIDYKLINILQVFDQNKNCLNIFTRLIMIDAIFIFFILKVHVINI